jgi:hypothetical protein
MSMGHLLNAASPAVTWIAERLDRRFHWDLLPRRLGILTLIGLRNRLRQRNLYDAGLPSSRAEDRHECSASSAAERTIDGRGTHPTNAGMGSVGTRFGRNAAVVLEDDLANSTPPPEDVSQALLQRTEFLPAKSLNLLAAGWLQFEVHDWFAHQVQSDVVGPLGVAPLKRDPDWPGRLPMHLSDQTHWWDASQLYGANERFAKALRRADFADSGKLEVDDELLRVIAKFMDTSEPDSGRGHAQRTPDPVPNLWLGLAIFHVAFAREHNAICDRLHEVYPHWTGDRLYAKARLINAAVMAKIHTVEWTAALLAHPATVTAIRSTWWGLLGERCHSRFGRLHAGEILSGIPGSRLDDEVPYSLTEEFAAVYRMHPLLPDAVTFRRAADGARMDDLAGGATIPFEQLAMTRDDGDRPREQLQRIGYENACYSLAVSHPGALTLHNYPSFKPLLASGAELDLGAVDILRTRECAIPRYNAFRRSLRLPAATSFHALADGNPRVAREIEKVYDSVEDVDLIVGLLADRKPAGFAISETSFRIFLLMAARRLRSDPFFTTHYKPAVYTRAGLDWIDNASMAGILRRHYPALEPALRGVDNAFQPWSPITA